MKRLFLVELLKLRTYTVFWVMLGLYAAFIPLSFNFFLVLDLNIEGEQIDFFEFFEPGPDALWHYLLFSGSFSVYVMVLLILTYTNREQSSGVWRQYVIEGVSRTELLLAKTTVVLLISLIVTLLMLLIGSLLISHKGYDGVVTAAFVEWPFFLGFMLHFAGFMMIALCLNLIVPNTTIVFIAVFFWGLFVEGVFRWLDPTGLAHFLPVYNLNGLIPNPLTAMIGGEEVTYPGLKSVLMSLFWTAAAFAASWALLRRKDL